MTTSNQPFTAEQRLELLSIMKEAIKEERNEFWVQQPQHYLDHEFISAVRSGVSWGGKAGVGFIIVSTVAFVGGAIWLAIKGALGR